MASDLPFDKSKAQRTMDSDLTMYTSAGPNQPNLPTGGSSSAHGRIPSFTDKHQGGHQASYSSLSNEHSPEGTHVDHSTEYEMTSYPPKQGGGNDDGWYKPPQPSYIQPVDEGLTDGGEMTATDSEDEFNWDEDEQAEKDKADEGQPTGMGKHRARRGRRLYLWLMSLSRWFRTILIAFFGCAVAIVPFIVVMLEFRDNAARIEVQTWSLFLTIGWAVGCVTSVIVDFLPHLFVKIILYSMGRVPEKVKSYVELLMAILGYIKLFLQVVAAWVVLSVVRAAVHPPRGYWTYINRVMQALFAGALILLVEKFLLQLVAVNFHRTSLKDRLEENESALRALDKLSNAVPNLYARPFHKRAANSSSGNRRSHANPTPSHSRPGSPGPDIAIDYATGSSKSSRPDHQSPLVGEDGRVMSPEGQKKKGVMERRRDRKQERKDKKERDGNIAEKLVAGLGKNLKEMAMEGMFGKGPEIGSLASARTLARKLFRNLEKGRPPNDDGEVVLLVEDFYPYFRNMEDAKSAFRHFDSDDNGDISKREMRSAVQRIYRERKSLTASLADMSSAISKLDGVLLGVALVVFIFAAMLIFNRTSTISSLVPMSTIVLGFSFIFANSAKTLFESLIFIFATHAYDIGDMVLIDEDWLFVKEFGLVSTVFRRIDGQEIIAPNALLASSKLIHNITRSRAMWEVVAIQISYDTPLDVIEDLKTRVKAYLVDNSREWGGGLQLDIDSITQQNAIKIAIAIEHKNNWSDWGGRWGRRTAFMKALKQMLETLEVTYSLPVQPVYMEGGNAFPTGSVELGNAGTGGPYSASGFLNPFSAAGRPSLSVNTQTQGR